MIAAKVIADLDFIQTFDHLVNQATIADHLSRVFQHERPQTESIGGVALQVAFDPVVYACTVERRRIVAHGFAIADDEGERIRVRVVEFTKEEPRSFENRHSAKSRPAARPSAREYNPD